MAEDWDWPTCRQWSEKVFQRIEDDRLKSRWTDHAAIKYLQRDVCNPASKHHQIQYHPYPCAYQKPTAAASILPPASATPAADQQSSSQLINPCSEYAMEVHRKPCHKWNWGMTVGAQQLTGLTTFITALGAPCAIGGCISIKNKTVSKRKCSLIAKHLLLRSLLL